MVIVYTVLILFTLAALYPFVNVIAVSFSSSRAVGAGEVVLWPIEFNVDAYRQLLLDGQIFASMKNTVVLTVVGTFLNVFATTLAAYALSKRRLRGRKIFVGMIVFTMLFSGGMIPNFILIKSLHLMDTFSGLWLMGLISTYNMIVMKTSFESVPESLCEAASIDGATSTQQLFRITLPLLRPTTELVVLLQLIACFKVFGQIQLITGGGPAGSTKPLIQYIYETAFSKNNLGYAAAMSYVLFGILLVLSLAQLIMQKRGGDK